MKRTFFFTFISISLLFSCSTSNEEEDGELPQQGYELEAIIVGKWDVDNSNTTTNSYQKQNETNCYIFSLIFNADGSFIITHQTGTLTGNYIVESENSINLGSAGSLGNIESVANSLSLLVDLEGICTKTAHLNRFSPFWDGNCYSFLNCHDNTFWKAIDDEKVTFLNFKNHSGAEYFNMYNFYNTRDCKEITSSQDEDEPYFLIENQSNLLRIINQGDEEIKIYTYRIRENGLLKEQIETDGEITERNFEPALESDLEEFSNYLHCDIKTYVPDDIFEQELIRMGVDDVLDDYVLTENIKEVTDLAFYNWEITDMTGIEGFVNLKELYLQPESLGEIDLTKNVNLVRLFLHSRHMTELDLSKNIKLESLYFEYAPVQTLDLSHNTELRAVELQLMPLTSIDISKNKKLEMFTIEGSGFKELISDENRLLWHLNISSNGQFQHIGFDAFPNLTQLILGNNKISEIDVSSLSSLEYLDLEQNNLTALDVSNNLELDYLRAGKNPNLNCIQIAEMHQVWLNGEDAPGNFEWYKDETAEYSLDCP